MRSIPKIISESFTRLVVEVTTCAVSLGRLFSGSTGGDIDALFGSVLELYGYSDEDLNFEIFSSGIHSAWMVRMVFHLPEPDYGLWGIKTSSLRVRHIGRALAILFQDSDDPVVESFQYAIKNIELTLRPFANEDVIAKTICSSHVVDGESWIEFSKDVIKLRDFIGGYGSAPTLPLRKQLLVPYLDKVIEYLVSMPEAVVDNKLFEIMKLIVNPDSTWRCNQNEAHSH